MHLDRIMESIRQWLRRLARTGRAAMAHRMPGENGAEGIGEGIGEGIEEWRTGKQQVFGLAVDRKSVV